MGKLKKEFSLGWPNIGGFAGDRLGIGRCEGGTGGPLMLRSPKLQRRASDPEGPKMGVPKIAPPNFFRFGVTCLWVQNGGVQKHQPHVCPLGVSCP